MMHDNYDPAMDVIKPNPGAPNRDGFYLIYIDIQNPKQRNGMLLKYENGEYSDDSTPTDHLNMLLQGRILGHIGPLLASYNP